MRKFIHRVAGVAIMLLAAGLGLALMFFSGRSASDWQEFAGRVTASRLDVFCTGCGVVLLAAVYALSGLRTRPRDKVLSFPNEGGSVSLGVNGIADYLGKLVTEFPTVVSIHPRILPLKDAMDVEMDVRIKAGPDVRDVCELLQAQVRKSLLDGLGISNVGKVTVNVTEIVTAHKPSRRSEA